MTLTRSRFIMPINSTVCCGLGGIPGRGSTYPTTFKPKVLAADTSRELRWIGHLTLPGVFDGEHRFTLTPTNGGSDLVQSEKFSGLLVQVGRKTIDNTADSFRLLNEALKKQVESEQAERG